MFHCKLLAFLIAHRTPVRQITLVPDKHYRHVSIRVLPRILQPACKVVESLPPEISSTHGFECQYQHDSGKRVHKKRPPKQLRIYGGNHLVIS